MDPPRDLGMCGLSIPFTGQVGHNADSTSDRLPSLECDVSSSFLGYDFQGKAIDGSLNLEGDIENNEQQTAHEKRKLNAAKAWEFSRALKFRCAVECSALPKVLCQYCNKVNSSVYCKQCGLKVYYCVECAVSVILLSMYFIRPSSGR